MFKYNFNLKLLHNFEKIDTLFDNTLDRDNDDV